MHACETLARVSLTLFPYETILIDKRFNELFQSSQFLM